jgi:hypothetical protein
MASQISANERPQPSLPPYNLPSIAPSTPSCPPHTVRFEELLPEGKAFVYAPPIPAIAHGLRFNAGVLIVRAGEAGLRVLDAWCDAYDPSQWVRGQDGRWRELAEPYTDAHDEQAFIRAVLPDPALAPLLHRLPYQRLQGGPNMLPPPDARQGFVMHFAGDGAKVRACVCGWEAPTRVDQIHGQGPQTLEGLRACRPRGYHAGGIHPLSSAFPPPRKSYPATWSATSAAPRRQRCWSRGNTSFAEGQSQPAIRRSQ